MSSSSDDESVVRQARPHLWTPDAPDTDTAPSLEILTAAPAAPAASPQRTRKAARVEKPAAADKASSGESAKPLVPRYSPTIRELPEKERPRERLHAHGAGALSTAELVAILLRVGNAERSAVSLGEFLLAHFGSIKGVACASLEELAHVKGIGDAKAAQIKAAIEFGNRLALFTEDARPSIGGPRDVANLLLPDLRYQKKEHLKSLLLERKNAKMSTSLHRIPQTAL